MVLFITTVLVGVMVFFGLISYLNGNLNNMILFILIGCVFAFIGYGALANTIPVDKKEFLLTNEEYYITKTPLRIIIETDEKYTVVSDINFYINTKDFDIYLIKEYNSYNKVINSNFEYRNRKNKNDN